MGDKLLIVESPGKVRHLTEILGPGWMVAASVGHIRDLPANDIGVSPPDFQPKYELTTRGREVATKLRSLVARADAVYLATDPDREGEAIAWHLQQVLKLPDPHRVTFGEITATAVTHAVAHPRRIDTHLAEAQEARRVLDRLVGYMVSPAVSRSVGGTLSAGRVQSPAVRLVVEREREIRAFRVTEHYSAQLTFSGTEGIWTAEWALAPHFVSEDAPYFMDKAFASRVSKTSPVTVRSCADSESRRSPPPPFTTSTMQQAASVVLKMDPKKTMELAQKLYEQGAITYHRTDNPNLSEEAFAEIRAYALPLKLPVLAQQRKWKAKPGAQEAHEAIRATQVAAKAAGATPEEQALYRLIRMRALASQMDDARYAVRTARMKGADLDGKPIEFEAKGRTLVYKGWLLATGGDQTDESGDGAPDNPVPALKTGQVLRPVSGKLLAKKTKPPARYTQASLVKKLEAEEIGRPSTYAAIMDNIQRRNYVTVSRQFLQPTPIAEQLVDAMVGTFQFIDLPFTRRMEADLDDIAQGKGRYLAVVQATHAQLERELAHLRTHSAPAKICPACQQATLYAARSQKGLAYWSCANPGCKAAFGDNQGQPGGRFGERPEAPAGAPVCPVCQRHPLVQAVGKTSGKPYWRCTGYPKCTAMFGDRDGAPGEAFGQVKPFPAKNSGAAPAKSKEPSARPGAKKATPRKTSATPKRGKTAAKPTRRPAPDDGLL